jgi:hypothetical protein
MEHRKRNGMQHKVELSTLLRIVMASKLNTKLHHYENRTDGLAKALAVEALESLKNCDRTEKRISRPVHDESWLGV